MAPPPRPPHGETAALRRLRPRRRYGRRRAACPPRSGDTGRSQRPAEHGRPRQSTRWRGSSASLRPSVTAAPDRAESSCGPAGRLARADDEHALRALRRLLSRRTGSETASATTGPMPDMPPSSSAPATADGNTAAGAEAQQITESTSRTTATRSARWRRKATRSGGSRSRGRARCCCDRTRYPITAARPLRSHPAP